MLLSTRSLWTFACELYSKPHVASACHQLQDGYAIDIPLLMFCCWSGSRYGELSSQQLQQALSFSKGWAVNTTKPLRAIRRDMKTSYSAQWPIAETDWTDLRERVKGLELKSEKLMLEGLNRSLEGLPMVDGGGSTVAAITHIKYCFRIDIDDTMSELLVCVLNEVFTGFDGNMRELIKAA